MQAVNALREVDVVFVTDRVKAQRTLAARSEKKVCERYIAGKALPNHRDPGPLSGIATPPGTGPAVTAWHEKTRRLVRPQRFESSCPTTNAARFSCGETRPFYEVRFGSSIRWPARCEPVDFEWEIHSRDHQHSSSPPGPP